MQEYQSPGAIAAKAFRSRWGSVILLSGSVFLACIVGILSRPPGFLATVWPANAVMLGLLLRMPQAANPIGWLLCAVAYMAADLLTGSTLLKAVLLNSANLIGIAAAYSVWKHVGDQLARLDSPAAMFRLLPASAIGGAAAGMIGAIANQILFSETAIRGWSLWAATELVNYVMFMPVLLSFPALRIPDRSGLAALRAHLWTLIPALSVAAACVLAVLVGGIGAIAFPVPALLWCGLVYRVFPTALLTLGCALWTLFALSNGDLPFPTLIPRTDEMQLVSLRLAVAFISIAPILIAAIMETRNRLLSKLQHQATHDYLTGVKNRSTFLEGTEQLLARVRNGLTVLMIDVDNFKHINDSYGHLAGDEVLKALTRRVGSCLRSRDLFGRMGGEEFAVVVAGCDREEALAIAERIRGAVAEEVFALPGDRSMQVTISIGVALEARCEDNCTDRLLAEADAALYLAKRSGRNRVELATQAVA